MPKYGHKPGKSVNFGTKARVPFKDQSTISNTKKDLSFGHMGFRKGVIFAEAVQGESSRKVLEFQSDSGVRDRLAKSYVGDVKTPGLTFNMQKQFFVEGFFAVIVIPLGPNLCLLKEQHEGVLKEMMES